MKKKILIMNPGMFIGGAERSLLGLLESFDFDKFDVDLHLYRHEGEFMDYIPLEVNLLPEIKAFTMFDRPVIALIKEGNLLYAFLRILSKLDSKIVCFLTGKKETTYRTMQNTAKYLTPFLPRIEGEYDVAINFLGIHDYLITKIDAKKKMGWLHTDYSSLDGYYRRDLKMWQKLDYIVNVSSACKEVFDKFFPTLANQSIVIENILAPTFVKKLADEFEPEDMLRGEAEYILCSIGRYSHPKNFDNAILMCKYLLENGMKVKWFIIGYGGEEEKLKELVRENKMEEHFIMLGKRKNPYPYIKKADYYIQPSRYEGKAVTVREAQILGKPVIITNFLTANSQLKDGFDGIILPMDNNEFARELEQVIKNGILINKVRENCLMGDYGNAHEIEKIYQIAEGL